jgi:hypothetical protein
MSWKSPTGHSTPTDWIYPEKTYDENTAIYAYCLVPPMSWGPFLELLISPATLCDKVRYYTIYSPNITAVDIDVYYDGNWHNVYEGAFYNDVWNEKNTPNGPFTISKARICFYNGHTVATRQARFGEFDLNQIIVRPLVGGTLAGSGLIGKGLI